MSNEYGLDYKYFENKLSLIVRDASRYTPGEMLRELSKYVEVARCSMKEPPLSVEQQAARIKELEEAYKNQLSMTANAEKELQRSINDSVKRIVELEESLNSIHGIATHRIEQVALLQCDILELQKQNEALKAENEAYKNAVPKDYILQSIAQKQYRQINDEGLAMEEKNKELKAENERLKEALKFVSMSAASLESAQDMAYDALQLSEGGNG